MGFIAKSKKGIFYLVIILCLCLSIKAVSFTEISVGTVSSCGLLLNGSVMCWGDNEFGGLGDGTNDNSYFPVYVSGEHIFSSVSTGSRFSCGLLLNDSVMCWGYNIYGQLGDGTTINSTRPVYVAGGYAIASISSGVFTACGLLFNGSALCWGYNQNEALGSGPASYSDTPVFVAGDHVFSSVSPGLDFSCGVLVNGSGMCWGINDYGQLGYGSALSFSPLPVYVAGGYHFVSISSSDDEYSCGLLLNGSVACWGTPFFEGSLGDETSQGSWVPVFVAGGYRFASVNAGVCATCGVLVNGSGMCWGANRKGQLGNGNTTLSNIPVFVVGGHTFSSINAGVTSCGLLVNGSGLCWGDNSGGQLGNGDNTVLSTSSPVYVKLPSTVSSVPGSTTSSTTSTSSTAITTTSTTLPDNPGLIATRHIPSSVAPGSSFTVTISLHFVGNVSGCGVKEYYPDGFGLSGESLGGFPRIYPSRIEWLLFNVSPLTDQDISYQILVPSDLSDGVYTFSGLVLPVGDYTNSTIGGSQSITVSRSCTMKGNSPPCNAIEIGEILNAITSWASGAGTSLQDILNMIAAWANGTGN